MKQKTACLVWIVVYVLVAAAVGMLVYRRFPVMNAALGAGVVGGFIAWMGIASLIGIRQKVADAIMIRRALGGEEPQDGAKIAAIGPIMPTSAQELVSPLTRVPSVAYKYEIRSMGKNDAILFEGFALAPSAIQSGQGSIRLLAYPDLQIPKDYSRRGKVIRNAEEYIRRTAFREPSSGTIREHLAERRAALKDDDGSVRIDQRNVSGEPDLEHVLFMEQIVKPGDLVCAIGRYSRPRAGLVPDPDAPLHQVTLKVGEPESFPWRAIGAIFGTFISGVIFLAIAIAGLLALFTFVPLEATEEMAPAMKTSWLEVRLERLIESRVREPLSKAGLFSDNSVVISLPRGQARGRVVAGGREVTLSSAAAAVEGTETTITLGDGAVILKIDRYDQPTRLSLLGEEMDPREFEGELDLQITEKTQEEISGRLTFFSGRDPTRATRVRFRAKI